MSTKSEIRPDLEVCSRPVLAASTRNRVDLSVKTPILAPERPGSSSLISDSLQQASTNRTPSKSSMRLTERDRDIVELVYRCRALRGDQIQVALFTAGGASRCQRRLTLLVRHRYLDHLPRKSVNEPAIYLLSRRSVNGNRLLRQKSGDAEFRNQLFRLGSVKHLLAVNDVRVRMERGCKDLGWELRLWQGPEQLSTLLSSAHLVPDAYFKIERVVNGQERTAAFFLELERAAKSRAVLRSKLKRYGELYYSGRYQQLFGIRALRVLVVFAASDGAVGHWVEAATKEARETGVTIARFASLEQLRSIIPTSWLTEAVWFEPRIQNPVALFSNPMDS